MAITNYSELKTTLASWIHHDGLTALIPDFITLAESRINRNLSPRVSETDTTLTSIIGSRYIALPSSFGKVYGMWLTTYLPRKELVYKVPEEIHVSNSNSLPTYYTIDGSNIAFNCPTDKEYTFTFRYKSKLDIASTSTNYILTNYPDLYLYASLWEAAVYIRDDDRIQTWKGHFDLALSEIKDVEINTRDLATLSTDMALSSYTNNNIIDGDY